MALVVWKETIDGIDIFHCDNISQIGPNGLYIVYGDNKDGGNCIC